MTDVSKELLPCDHKNAQMHYDHHSCLDCGAYMPDATGRRGTAAVHGEWFPSEDAFEHFKSTGVRAWNTRAQPAPADVVEAAYREGWHEGYATGDAGGSYGAVENDWLGSEARQALNSAPETR